MPRKTLLLILPQRKWQIKKFIIWAQYINLLHYFKQYELQYSICGWCWSLHEVCYFSLKYQTWLLGLPRTNTLAYSAVVLVTNLKKFYNVCHSFQRFRRKSVSSIWRFMVSSFIKNIVNKALGNRDIHAEWKISFINGTKWYKMGPRRNGWVLKNLLNFIAVTYKAPFTWATFECENALAKTLQVRMYQIIDQKNSIM